MRKTKSGKYVKRDSKSGKIIVKNQSGKRVTATTGGVSVTSSSTRRAKTSAKKVATYNNNLGSFVKNDRSESDSAISIRSKTQSELEKKYAKIKSK